MSSVVETSSPATVVPSCSTIAATTDRDRAREARTALLTGLTVFAGLMLTAAFGWDLSAYRDPNYSTRCARLSGPARTAVEKPLTVVMLGSSPHDGRTSSHVPERAADPRLSRPVVVANFGLRGGSPTTSLMNWNRLRRDGVCPDLVLIEVMPAMLNVSWYLFDCTEQEKPLSRLRHSDLTVLKKYFGDQRPRLRRDWWLSWLNTLFDQRLDLVSRFAPSLLPPEQCADPAPLPEDSPVALVEFPAERWQKGLEFAHGQYAGGLQQFQLGGRCCESLRELLASVRRDGARPVLVVMPEGPIYRSWYRPGAYEQVRGWLDGLRTEFGAEVIDAREWSEEAEFIDSHHLTSQGAAKFTARLGNEYLLPILRGSSRTPTEGGQRAAAR